MNESLQDVLAELAEGLGTSTGELWGWMQEHGIEAYARMQVAQLMVASLWALLATVLSAIVIKFLYCRLKEDEHADLDDMVMVELIPSTVFFISFISCAYHMVELAGWVASPEGALMGKLLSALH